MTACDDTGSPLCGLTGAGTAPAARGILGRLKAVLRALRRGRESRRELRGLQSLSDWQLKDIGMHRSQVWQRAGDIEAARSSRITYAKD